MNFSRADFRSDTVTRPTEAMLSAMLAAEVGDDVLGDDPTVKKLEEKTASLAGMEAAVFVPSGTMGNQIALATHCRPGDAVILEAESHIVYYEGGSPGVIAGVVTRTLPGVDGRMDPADIAAHATKRSEHTPGSVLLCLENTHNRSGGMILTPEQMAEYRTVAEEHGMRVHLDGARVFHACVALGVPLSAITKHVDSVSICFSKGLGAPVGSVLCGSTEFIREARFWRKRLGGGMRQAGFLAAAGLYCLDHMVDRLEEDHARARRLGAALAQIPGLTVHQDRIVTNFVMVHTPGPAAPWLDILREHEVDALPPAVDRIRLVLHHQVGDDAAERCAAAFRAASERLVR